MRKFTVIAQSSGRTVLEEVGAADGFLARMLGLMGRRSLRRGHGLWLPRTSSVHTCFMRFAIDVVYLDTHKRVEKIVGGLRPWRVSWCWGADSVLEAPAGWAAELGLRTGESLRFSPKQAQTA